MIGIFRTSRAMRPSAVYRLHTPILRGYSTTQQSNSVKASPATGPEATYQAPRTTVASSEEPNRPNIYKLLGRPFAKVFLGAMFTYQVLYYAWERMRLNEIKDERTREIEGLEGEVDVYKRRRAEGTR